MSYSPLTNVSIGLNRAILQNGYKSDGSPRYVHFGATKWPESDSATSLPSFTPVVLTSDPNLVAVKGLYWYSAYFYKNCSYIGTTDLLVNFFYLEARSESLTH